MAEGVLLNIAQQLLANLASEALNNTKLPSGVKSELRKLEATLSTVKAVLVDAEEKRHTNNQVKVWLDMLEGAVYGADNLVEEFRYEELQRKTAKKVRLFFSSSNHVAFLLKIGRKVRKIREKAVLDVLLDCGETKDSVSAIPIVGIGGLGKTTIAQLVFNDEEVQKHFERRIWVCVADVFDVKLLVEKIIRSVTCESPDQNLDLEQLQNQLRREIQGRRFLLVLDDVWNEDSEKWLRLERLLRGGARGSGVLINYAQRNCCQDDENSRTVYVKGFG